MARRFRPSLIAAAMAVAIAVPARAQPEPPPEPGPDAPEAPAPAPPDAPAEPAPEPPAEPSAPEPPSEAPTEPAPPPSEPAKASPAESEADGPVIELAPEQARADERGGDTLTAPEHPTKVTLGGYGQHEFIAAEGENTRFRNHRFVLFVHGQISKRISTSTEIEFEFAGSPLKRDGELGPGEVLLEYSVVDFELAMAKPNGTVLESG